MPLFCDALTAYRRDLERVGDLVRFGSADDRWLKDALRLERLVTSRALGAASARSIAKAPLLKPGRLLALTERIEAAGALTLSFNMLDSARRLWDVTDAHAAGMALCQQARICRSMNESDAAGHYYAAAIQLGARRGLPDVRGGALIGRGVMHGIRGEITAAYRAFGEARRVAGQIPDILANAYIGEMAAASVNLDSNRVIVVGAQALRVRPLTPVTEATLLMVISSAAMKANRPRAAGMLLRRALACSRHARLRMHLFAKMANVAAMLGDRTEIGTCERKLRVAAARVNVPVDELGARSEIAKAYALAGDTIRARRMAKSLRAEAVAIGYANVVNECDAILKNRPLALPPHRLSRPANRVISAFEVA